ncbi:sedoheptulose 7-phosphate cyclase [Kitasatospora sp. NPDC008050]|uniref:sedoheptulose 7-phosphate cyclase n=1 Tax=Kitasatospora sp. NPDC008050 TaxID=3364021 RepID=UPI0036EBBDA1
MNTDETHSSSLDFSELSNSWRVRAVKPVDYEVRICHDVFEPGNRALIEHAAPAQGRSRRFVVIDAEVDRCHGDRIRRFFEHHDIDYFLQVVRAEETVKEFETASEIVVALDSFGLDRRREPIIAIGGGVLLDIVGLVANLYRRGTPVVRVPTTLIGLVDAGIGVKTGVNFNGHKNRLGTYFAPSLTLLDRSFLATVERRHIANGMAEILKMALIKDAQLFNLLEEHGPRLIDQKFQGGTDPADPAEQVIRLAIHGMLEELQPNLWEHTLERIVDYGHTFSPTLEMRALPALLHGEAVCIDMALTTVLGWRRGLLDTQQRDRVLGVMRALELPRHHDLLDADLLARALQDTVRHRDGEQRLPLPVGIGDAVFVNDVSHGELAVAVEDLRTLAARELSRV